MHPNPAFRKTPRDRNLNFAAQVGFGVLAVADESGLPLLSHIPFVIEDDAALFHLVRSNPIVARLAAPHPARLAVSGPHSYVSPDWYGTADQVPTWNYVAVHLTGMAEALPQTELRPMLDSLSHKFEAQLAPKPEWTSEKMTDGVMDRMMRQIVPFRLHITDVQGTWKLAQNKPEAARLAASDGVAQFGMGSEVQALADLMRTPPPEQQ
ncbi:FMN-binding negative transcriptional regulator [Thalassovita taeanensis]|uniref:Negative transcriptional regulator, PaiB family n=1 Tax=Thalassovita taeanensis TaxID=657014 RepID=A0A1H9I6A1_9RHOB|nr:FMN-binding negative transcriptional regulator [Thalassovita taeanensis]SEQ70093.1 negative transcriptional regulator, PaiB family [Thalassovita taeanensis]